MVGVIWSDDAVVHLNSIIDYLEAHDPMAAKRIARDLIAAAMSLEGFPNRGRPVAPGIRELVKVRPYILRYRIVDDAVLVLGLRHSAQMPSGIAP